MLICRYVSTPYRHLLRSPWPGSEKVVQVLASIQHSVQMFMAPCQLGPIMTVMYVQKSSEASKAADACAELRARELPDGATSSLVISPDGSQAAVAGTREVHSCTYS